MTTPKFIFSFHIYLLNSSLVYLIAYLRAALYCLIATQIYHVPIWTVHLSMTPVAAPASANIFPVTKIVKVSPVLSILCLIRNSYCFNHQNIWSLCLSLLLPTRSKPLFSLIYVTTGASIEYHYLLFLMLHFIHQQWSFQDINQIMFLCSHVCSNSHRVQHELQPHYHSDLFSVYARCGSFSKALLALAFLLFCKHAYALLPLVSPCCCICLHWSFPGYL
jgi:hypothetical protein